MQFETGLALRRCRSLRFGFVSLERTSIFDMFSTGYWHCSRSCTLFGHMCHVVIKLLLCDAGTEYTVRVLKIYSRKEIQPTTDMPPFPLSNFTFGETWVTKFNYFRTNTTRLFLFFHLQTFLKNSTSTLEIIYCIFDVLY